MDKKIRSISEKGLLIFFLLLIYAFAGYNAYEMFFDMEACGQKKGLAKMDTLLGDAVGVWGGMQRLLGVDYVLGSSEYSDVLRLENGKLIGVDPINDVAAAMEGVEVGQELARECGSEFLFVQAPSKQTEDKRLPKEILGYELNKYAEMITYLEENKVPYIDMRKALLETERDYTDFFFDTDHHWNTSAAFICYQQIAHEMRGMGFEIEETLLEEDKYKKDFFEDVFMGSRARIVGPYFGGVDDYELWLPAFDTLFEWRVPEADIQKEGTFAECFLFEENLREYSYDYYAYYAYFNKDYGLMEIINHNKKDGARIILVKDSMAVPVATFLMHQCAELDVIDLRYPMEMDVEEYILQQNPDLIIYLFGTGYLHDRNAIVIE